MTAVMDLREGGASDGDSEPTSWSSTAPAEPHSSVQALPRVGDTLRDRFVLLEELGSGSHGIVFLARDESSGDLLALKALRSVVAIPQFKREYRFLSQCAHPNLVTASELFSDRHPAFITMPYVRGRTLDEVLEGSTSPAAIGLLFSELASAVHALHQSGLVHRDLKPSNVLVSDDSVVHLIDFGMACFSETDGSTFGSPAYAAPECILGAPATPASDWYSLGVMLYQILEGVLPFRGTREEVLRNKCDRDAPPLSQATKERAPSLARLALTLLSRSPNARPSTDEILESFGAGSRASDEPKRLFLGRERELEALLSAAQTALSGRLEVLQVSGPSGIGKTSLVAEFLSRFTAMHPTSLVLSGCCYEHERTTYNTWDPLVTELYEAGELNDIAVASAQEFEVLADAFLDLGGSYDRPKQTPGGGSAAARVTPGRTLGRILRRLSDSRPLVLVMDQLRWGDEDSARILLDAEEELIGSRVLILLVCRDDERESSAFLCHIAERRPDLLRHTLEVGALDAQTCRDLLRGLNAPSDVDCDRARGNPMVLRLMAFGDASYQTLSDDARNLGQWIALSGHNVDQSILQKAAEIRDMASAVRQLQVGGWICALRRGTQTLLRVSHDWTEAWLRRHVTAPEAARLHKSLAQALIEAHAAPEEVAEHFYHAQAWSELVPWAQQSASRARKSKAYANEAEWLERLIESPPSAPQDRPALREKLARAWAKAGHGEKAAEHYLLLAESSCEKSASQAATEQEMKFRLKAADQFFRSDKRERGFAELNTVLRHTGLSAPQSRSTTLLRLLAVRFRLRFRSLDFKGRAPNSLTPREHLRLEAVNAAKMGYRYGELLLMVYYSGRSLELSLEAGHHAYILQNLADELLLVAGEGTRQKKRIEELAQRVDQLASVCESASSLIYVELTRAAVTLFLAQFGEAAHELAKLEERIRLEFPALTWELSYCRMLLITAEQFHGGLVRMSPRLDEWLADAESRSDTAALRSLNPKRIWTLIAQDRRSEAFDALSRALTEHAGDGRSRYDIARVQLLFQEAFFLLSAGIPSTDTKPILAGLRRFHRSSMRRLQGLAVTALALEGAILVSKPLNEEKRGRRRVEGIVRRLKRERAAFADSYAYGLEAVLAHQDGQVERALDLLSQGIEGFHASGMRLAASSLRLALGRVQGGVGGQRLHLQGKEELREAGVENPEAFIRIHAPGFADAFEENTALEERTP